MPYDNRDTAYLGSYDDAALNAGVERVKSDRRARAYARRAYQPTGEPERPLVTLHNTLDPVVPFWHEEIYAGLATLSWLFVPSQVDGYGHCEFSREQILGAFDLLKGLAGDKVQTHKS